MSANSSIERPIIFSAPMIEALFAGRKTQTRRTLRGPRSVLPPPCPYGFPGQWLWVRETFRERAPGRYAYRADADPRDAGAVWRSSLFMPRKASRLLLRLEETRIERLQQISEADALAEGVQPAPGESARAAWQRLWDSINGKRAPFCTNPWVWVLRFTLGER